MSKPASEPAGEPVDNAASNAAGAAAAASGEYSPRVSRRDYLRLGTELVGLAWKRVPARLSLVLGAQAAQVGLTAAIALGMRATVNEAIQGHARAAAIAGLMVALACTAGMFCGALIGGSMIYVVERVALLDLMPEVHRDVATLEGIEHLERTDFLDRLTVASTGMWMLMYGFFSAIRVAFTVLQLGVTLLLLGSLDPWLMTLPVFAGVPLWWEPARQARGDQGRDRHRGAVPAPAAPVRRGHRAGAGQGDPGGRLRHRDRPAPAGGLGPGGRGAVPRAGARGALEAGRLDPVRTRIRRRALAARLPSRARPRQYRRHRPVHHRRHDAARGVAGHCLRVHRRRGGRPGGRAVSLAAFVRRRGTRAGEGRADASGDADRGHRVRGRDLRLSRHRPQGPGLGELVDPAGFGRRDRRRIRLGQDHVGQAAEQVLPPGLRPHPDRRDRPGRSGHRVLAGTRGGRVPGLRPVHHRLLPQRRLRRPAAARRPFSHRGRG